MALIPYVIEKTNEGERSYDLFSRLLKDRIVFIGEEVNSQTMSVAASEILFLNSQDSEAPIYVYISCPGGSVIDGLGTLIDTMKYVKAPVWTIALGMAASMGAAILSAGEPGHRYCMKHSSILVHPMSGGCQGRTADNIISINYEKRLQALLLSEIAHNCHRMSDESYDEIYETVQMLKDSDENMVIKLSKKARKEYEDFKKVAGYDHWMFAKEALEFGIIDKVLTNEADLDAEMGN